MSVVFELLMGILGLIFEVILGGIIEGIKWVWRKIKKKHKHDKKKKV